jgi:hypothetical protein
MVNRILNILVLLTLILGCTARQEKVVDTNRITSKNFRKFASTHFQMSGEELDLAECFQQGKDVCYEEYPYDKILQGYFEAEEEFRQRDAQVKGLYQNCVIDKNIQCAYKYKRDDLVQTLNRVKKESILDGAKATYYWLKLGKTKISQLWSFLSEIKRLGGEIMDGAKNVAGKGKNAVLTAAHGTGIGFGASAFAGVGVTFRGEAVIHNKKMALFCAPGLMAITDLGVQVGMGPIKTLQCKSNEEYIGKFLTVSVGVSGELAGIPAGAELSYSFGFSVTKFLDELQKEVDNGNLNIKKVPAELASVMALPYPALMMPGVPGGQLAWMFAMKTTANFYQQESLTNQVDQQIFKNAPMYEKEKLNLKTFSFGKVLKNMLLSEGLKQSLKKRNSPNLYLFLTAMGKSFSGCDSVSGQVALSVTASPVNASIIMSNYNKLYEVNLDKLISWRNVTAFYLMNPILMDKETVKSLVDLSKVALRFPDVVKYQCAVPAMEAVVLNMSRMSKIIRDSK